MTTIEIKQSPEDKKYYAIVRSGKEAFKKSELYYTEAAAKLAGERIFNRLKNIKA